jgi:uncharacterized Fe-S center protein
MPGKLERLISTAGIDKIDFKNKFVAIKVHFGEPGNLSFLRPNFAKVLADHITRQGGYPFLTDCNTLYVGRRNNALVHLDAAAENGWNELSTGCQNIIADGLKGNDDVEVPVAGGLVCKSAFIGRAVMDADIFISLNHFKLHEQTGYGGALKNIGMGCGSRGGKMAMHSDKEPLVEASQCIGCKLCARFCNHDAISFGADASGKIKAHIDLDKCVGCGRCIGACNQNAINPTNDSSNEKLCQKIAEYSKAVLEGRPHFHITVINQVSPYCDCHAENDTGIVPDIGVFASFDPVALDRACVDALNAAPIIPLSILDGKVSGNGEGADKCTLVHPTTDWQVQISHAEKIGLGKSAYDLTKL